VKNLRDLIGLEACIGAQGSEARGKLGAGSTRSAAFPLIGTP
jgi:hypothetical protein